MRRFAREFKPDRIIVFGSHAYGDPGPFSDLDLLIVMPYEGSPLQQAARMITRVNPKIGVDIIISTAEPVRERVALQDGFLREISQSVGRWRMKPTTLEWVDEAEGGFTTGPGPICVV